MLAVGVLGRDPHGDQGGVEVGVADTGGSPGVDGGDQVVVGRALRVETVVVAERVPSGPRGPQPLDVVPRQGLSDQEVRCGK